MMTDRQTDRQRSGKIGTTKREKVFLGILVGVLLVAVAITLFTPKIMVVDRRTVIAEPNRPTFPDQVQESLKGVVHLQCPFWQGSGFVTGPRLIVTARHCVEGVEDFLITTHGGHQVRATRAISDKEREAQPGVYAVRH
jgi:V8-like Glu-specific endopeptidase